MEKYMKTCSADQATINQSKDDSLDGNNSNLEMTVMKLYGNLNGNKFQESHMFQDWHLEFKRKQFCSCFEFFYFSELY